MFDFGLQNDSIQNPRRTVVKKQKIHQNGNVKRKDDAFGSVFRFYLHTDFKFLFGTWKNRSSKPSLIHVCKYIKQLNKSHVSSRHAFSSFPPSGIYFPSRSSDLSITLLG